MNEEITIVIVSVRTNASTQWFYQIADSSITSHIQTVYVDTGKVRIEVAESENMLTLYQTFTFLNAQVHNQWKQDPVLTHSIALRDEYNALNGIEINN